jgi:hypothetical protein
MEIVRIRSPDSWKKGTALALARGRPFLDGIVFRDFSIFVPPMIAAVRPPAQAKIFRV